MGARVRKSIVALTTAVLVLLPVDGGSAGATSALAETRPCPVFTAARNRGPVTDPALAEVSGLGASRVNPGVYWAHGDSGSAAELHALSSTGERLVTFALQGALAVDWEDVAVGPGPVPGQAYVYLADIGDNAPADRPDVTVYRVPEPVVTEPAAVDPVALTGVEAFTLEYPDGAHDAETLLVDPRSGDLFIVTKTLGAGSSGVYRVAGDDLGPGPTDLSLVASLAVPSAPFTGSTVTAGDISPNGDEILLRTYFTAFVWRRGPLQSVAGALSGARCPVPLSAETQGEAIAYRRDGNAYLTTSEWRDAGPRPLYEYRSRWRPDGLIRRGGGPFVGDEVVNRTGVGQSRSAAVARGGTATFTVRVTNDGDRIDDLRVQGSRPASRFDVRFRRNGADITAAVLNGTYRVQDVASGAGVPVVVAITARPGAPSGAAHAIAVTLTSARSAAAKDRVRATVTVR